MRVSIHIAKLVAGDDKYEFASERWFCGKRYFKNQMGSLDVAAGKEFES